MISDSIYGGAAQPIPIRWTRPVKHNMPDGKDDPGSRAVHRILNTLQNPAALHSYAGRPIPWPNSSQPDRNRRDVFPEGEPQCECSCT